MSSPAFQFYPGDWLRDAQLGMASPCTRGVWVDLLCAIWTSDRGGSIAGSPVGLSRICRCTEDEIVSALAEIRDLGIAEVEQDGDRYTITSRRMRKDLEERKKKRERDRRHYAKSRRDSDGDSDGDSDAIPTEFRRSFRRHSTKTEEEVEESNKKKKVKVRDHARAREAEGYQQALTGNGPAVDLYTQRHGTPPPLLWLNQIKTAVKDLEVWETTLDYWDQQGYKLANVTGLLSHYERSLKSLGRSSTSQQAMTYEEMLADSKRKRLTPVKDYIKLDRTDDQDRPLWQTK